MEPVTSSRFRMGEGDWFCVDPLCGNINFARRTKCNRCGKASVLVDKCDIAQQKKKLGQEIGKVAAEKSRGLFSADDWQCNKCGNVNWARRQQCNMCNAPKWGEVEERTGYGGGYNDRGVVEYIEHNESDDEYDEFGRKKKKKTQKSGDEDSSNDEDEECKKEVVRGGGGGGTAGGGEEEDEDEEEDDEDLSKYDLSDWGDVPPAPTGADDKQKNKDKEERSKKSHETSRKKSRSRSRSPCKDVVNWLPE